MAGALNLKTRPKRRTVARTMTPRGRGLRTRTIPEQIADHLGVSHSAVEARLHRARQRLRIELEAQEKAKVRR